MGFSNVLIFRCVCRIFYMVTSRGFPGSSAGICLPCRRPWFRSWVRKIPWRRDSLPIPVFLGLPGDSAGKESTCNELVLGSISGLGRSPGEGKSYPLLYSVLENSVDCISPWAAKSQTQLRNFHQHTLFQL